MELRKSVFINSVVFFAIALVVVVAMGLEIWPLVMLTKPLLLILLSLWFFFSSRKYGNRFTLLIQTGLFFSLIGDVALMLSEKNEFNFLLGLGSFLIAVFAYALAFIQNVIDLKSRNAVAVSLLLSAFISAAGVWALYILRPHLHEMQLPVLGASLAMILMCCAAAFRFKRTYARSFWAVYLGACLLLLSNALMIYDRFVADVEGAVITVTMAYAIAQYLIVRGALIHIQRKRS